MSWVHPGHDLLLSLSGEGAIQIGGRRFVARPGDFIWADSNHGDVSWPRRDRDWEFYWIRADSGILDLAADTLDVRTVPVLTLADAGAATAIFDMIIDVMARRPVAIDAALNAAVSQLIAIAFEARAVGGFADARRREAGSSRLLDALEQFRGDYARPWRIGDMAHLAGYSPPQFYRVFRKLTGASPIDWLRHERINEAKRQLAESVERIQVIAHHVGYADPYYFSRDFRKLVGLSPSAYRREHHELRRLLSTEKAKDS